MLTRYFLLNDFRNMEAGEEIDVQYIEDDHVYALCMHTRQEVDHMGFQIPLSSLRQDHYHHIYHSGDVYLVLQENVLQYLELAANLAPLPPLDTIGKKLFTGCRNFTDLGSRTARAISNSIKAGMTADK